MAAINNSTSDKFKFDEMKSALIDGEQGEAREPIQKSQMAGSLWTCVDKIERALTRTLKNEKGILGSKPLRFMYFRESGIDVRMDVLGISKKKFQEFKQIFSSILKTVVPAYQDFGYEPVLLDHPSENGNPVVMFYYFDDEEIH